MYGVVRGEWGDPTPLLDGLKKFRLTRRSFGFRGKREVVPNPIEQQFDNIGLLFGRQRAAFRNMMPFFEAPAATAGAGVLRREDGVPLHRCLFAVVGNIRWGKP